MSFDAALHWTELALGLACAQQSAEHLASAPDERRIFLPRLLLSLVLVTGLAPVFAEAGLLLLSGLALRRFRGPYNGGSDRMTLLVLCCALLARVAPTLRIAELALGYLALQLVLSYALAGVAKLANPEWRDGRALADLFAFSAYPVSEDLRGLARLRRSLVLLGWAILLFELLFPLALFDARALACALVIAAAFHLANACLLGLNRLLWIWLAAFPALIWLQERAFEFARR